MTPSEPEDVPAVGTIHVVTLDPGAPSLTETVRLLGHRSQRPIPPALKAKIELIADIAHRLTQAQGIYGIWSRASLHRCPLPPPWGNPVSHIALGAVTIGDALEKQASALSRKGALSEAVILDACGSTLVEAAADLLDARIQRDARALGWSDGRRRSPGYEDWPLRAQKELLEVLHAERIGISLSAGMAMNPKKSISFAKPIEPSSDSRDEVTRQQTCAHCDLESCPYRKRPGGSP